MIVTVQRTEVRRDCTLGIIACGSDMFFCMEHTTLRGFPMRATRAGQYALHADVCGLYFQDDSNTTVRIDFGRTVKGLAYPVVLIGCVVRENKLYDTSIAADRLYSLIFGKPNNAQIELRDVDPAMLNSGDMTWR